MKNFSRSVFLGLIFSLTACGGGGGGGGPSDRPTTDITLTVSGTVSSLHGTLAMKDATGLQTLWAGLFGQPVAADLYGVAPAAGAVVHLYKINSIGSVVGEALASATTDGAGNYSLTATGSSSDLALGMGLIVRAGTTESLTALVASATTNIDPVSTATFGVLVASMGDLGKISLTELAVLQEEVAVYANQIDLAAATSNSAMVTAIENEFKNSVTASSMLANMGAAEQICGSVTDAGNSSLAGILIEARDFNDSIVRARSISDADGKYCINVAPGDYIFGARNEGNTSFTAGEWYDGATGAVDIAHAAKVVVAAGDTKTIDYQLALGGRISGKVKAGVQVTSGLRIWAVNDPLPDILISVRRYDDYSLVATTRSAADGVYYLNVAPGDYFVMASNQTTQPYATEIYDNAGGRAIWQYAGRVVVTAANTSAVGFPLSEGKRVAGVVKRNDGSVVAAQRIRIDESGSGGAVERIGSRVDGSYRLWLRQNNQYVLYCRGQSVMTDFTLGNKDDANFVGQVAELTLKLVETADTNKPVADAKVILHNASWGMVSQEPSRGDGSVTVYLPNYDASSSVTDDYYLEFRIDDGRYLASQIYDGQSSKFSGTMLTIARNELTRDMGAVNIAAGGVLRGKVVYNDGVTPASNKDVRIYAGGATNEYRFAAATTKGDGTFILSLPAGTNALYKLLRVGNTWGNCPTGCLDIDLTDTGDAYTPEFSIVSGADFIFGDNSPAHVIRLAGPAP